MISQSSAFNQEAFSASFCVSLSKLAGQSVKSMAKTLQRLRINQYQRYLETAILDDCEESLLMFYEKTELPTAQTQLALIEASCTSNFNQNATNCLAQAFKKVKNNADVEVNLAFYDSFKEWMIAVEDFRNILSQINLYVEDVSIEILKRLENKTEDRLGYSVKFKHIVYIVFLKTAKACLTSIMRFSHTEACKQIVQGLLVIAFAMLFGTEQAKMANKLQRIIAAGLLPLAGFMDILNPIKIDAKVEDFLEKKQANVHIHLMREEIKKSSMFFKGATNKLRQLLNDYAQLMNEAGKETQPALDKKIMMVRVLEALAKGQEYDTDVLDDFIKLSGVRLIDVGKGWQELDDSPDTTMKSSKWM